MTYLSALVGSTDDDYVSGLEEFLKQHSHVWSGWTYRIMPIDETVLSEQKKKQGYFHLYLHYIKARRDGGGRKGSGDIEAVAVVSNWISSTNLIGPPESEFTTGGESGDYEAKAWLKITKIIRPKKFIETRRLVNYHNGKELNPSTLQSRFAPVIDVLEPLISKHMTEEDFRQEEEQDEKRSQRLSDKELEARAKQAKGRPVHTQTVTGLRLLRNPDVAAYAKRRAKGRCQLCGGDAPFHKQGTPYLEVHHIVWISKGGEDTLENTVALCPNCHRKMHILDLQRDRSVLLSLIK